MIKPDKPENEAARLAALRSYEILDTPQEPAFDDLLAIAVAICAVPMGLVSFLDADRQWFKARYGLDATETPREMSFCAHAILEPEGILIVSDTLLDPRFCDHSAVIGPPNIRFYAGAPLLAQDGEAVGTFCVMDHRPRQLESAQIAALQALSRQASRLLELRRVSGALNHQLRERAWFEQQLLQYQNALEARNADLAEQSRTDPLTGLPNRRAFASALEAALENARATGAALNVAVIDVDHFKMINDVHGHVEGDHVLQAIADVLKSHNTARGRVARYGGEEFVMLLEMPLEQAQLQCEFLREAIANLPLGIPLTVSIGIAAYRSSDEADTTFARADRALYDAKHNGRNCVVATP